MLGLGPMGEREGHIKGDADGLSRGWLWWLIAGRVAVGALLLGFGALWTGFMAANGSGPGRLSGALPVAVAVLLLSILYSLALRFDVLRPRRQAGVQFALDVLLTTWLVWLTGSPYSPYSALYIVVISIAG